MAGHFRAQIIDLIRQALGQRLRALALLVLATGLEISLRLAGPKLVGRFIDVVGTGVHSSMASLLRLASLFLIVTIAGQVARALSTYTAVRLETELAGTLRRQLAERVLALDMTFHDQHSPGELVERIDGDVGAVTSSMLQIALGAVGPAILVAWMMVLLFGVSPAIGAVSLLFAVAGAITVFLTKDVGLSAFAGERAARATLTGFVEQTLRARDDLRGNGAAGFVVTRFARLHEDLTKSGVSAIRGSAIYSVVVTNAVVITGYAVVLAICVYDHLHSGLSLGAMFVVSLYYEMLRAPLQNVGQQAHVIMTAPMDVPARKSIGTLSSVRARATPRWA